MLAYFHTYYRVLIFDIHLFVQDRSHVRIVAITDIPAKGIKVPIVATGI